MHDKLIQSTTAFFEEKYQKKPDLIVISPGRINIIGEHIDYNDGYVLPAAIDKVICFAFAKNNTPHANISAIDIDDSFEMAVEEKIELTDVVWTNYLRGVIKQLQENGYAMDGFDCAFSSTIPVGSGLSSSAALECGFLYGIRQLFGLQIERLDVALMGQKAEHWVGINCGIMDQFASVFGKENKVIKIDCRTQDITYHQADFKDYTLVLLDSNVKHSLFTSAYNQRRNECDKGIEVIKSKFPEIKSYRDCTMEHVLAVKDQVSEDVFKRIRFVVSEIHRVNDACVALDGGNIEALGQLLFETHKGLSEDYEVSCAELDFLVAQAHQNPNIIGARLMGGGFGGCTINLVKKGFENEIIAEMESKYQQQFGITLKSYLVKISNGTHLAK